jgi:hypothetical protein
MQVNGSMRAIRHVVEEREKHRTAVQAKHKVCELHAKHVQLEADSIVIILQRASCVDVHYVVALRISNRHVATQSDYTFSRQ